MELIFITTMLQAVILVIVLAIIFTASQLVRRKNGRSSLFARRSGAIESMAVVLAMEETGVFMNQQPLIKLQMQVLPERGRNFVVEVREVMSAVDQAAIRSGSTVRVRYNPDNLKETVLIKQ